MAAVASISSRSTGLAEQYGSSAVAKVIVPSGIDRVPIWEGQLVRTTRPQPWTLAALVGSTRGFMVHVRSTYE